jgi:NDP-hexose-3-ketoreductase
MRILFLGFSKFVRGKILPFLNPGEIFSKVGVASKSHKNIQDVEFPVITDYFPDYEQAIEAFSPDIVYISLVNNLHAPWIEKCLAHSCHVIVDKPACMNLADANRLLDLADSKQLCLAEALAYAGHPQLESIRTIFANANIKPEKIVTTFSFPPFDNNNFRLQKRLGGGALWDLGPYAVSIGRLLFEEPVDTISAQITNTHAETHVITGFSMLAKFPRGRSVLGHFGFETEYRNTASIMGRGMNIELDRLYTTPYDFSNTLRIHHLGDNSETSVAPCNAPVEFINAVAEAIRQKDWLKYSENLREDALAMEKLARALDK